MATKVEELVHRTRKQVKEFGGNKPFVPKGFQVAKKVDGPNVKLLKSLRKRLDKMHSTLGKGENQKSFNYGVDMCIQELDRRIKKEAKLEGTYIKIPKTKTK